MDEKVDIAEKEVGVSPVAETNGPTSSNSRIIVTSPPSGRPGNTDEGASTNGHEYRKVDGDVVTGREPTINQIQDTQPFISTGKTATSIVTTASPASIQQLVDNNPTKKGICLLFSCTKPWSGKSIGESDVVRRMRACLAKKLGYLVVKEETNASSHQLEQTLAEVEKLTLPKSYRVFFYFFGHGNDTSICLKDKSYMRTDIIKRLQSISSTNSKICKIFFFDCCRTISVGSQPIQVVDNDASSTTVFRELFSETNSSEGDFTPGPNTFIIYATDFNSKAYFISHLDENEETEKEVNGCGLATLFLTKLAPIRNESLANLLTEVRSEVYKYIKDHPESAKQSGGSLCCQLLNYKDRLMEKVNFLAESTGAVRVTPTGINITPSVLNTNISWKFSDDVESRIKHFKLSVRPVESTRSERYAIDPVTTPSKDRSASLSNLKPSTEYHLTIAAEYEDGKQGLSKQTFKTADRSTPKNIQIISNRSSDAADISWDFSGDASGLSCFIVKAEREEVKEPVEVKITDTSIRKATLTPLIPSSTYSITVTAVYIDNVEEKCSKEFDNYCHLSKATGLSATLIRLDPPKIELNWSYEAEAEDGLEPQHFEVLAQPDHNSSATSIPITKNPSECQAILELTWDTNYTLTVTTTYGNNIKIESEAIKFTSHTENEVKPAIVRSKSKEQTSADIEFTPPQRSEYGERLRITGYSILVRPHGYPGSEETSENGGIPDEQYTRDIDCSELNALPNQHYRVKVAGLSPGSKYKVKVFSHYSSGEIVASGEDVVETKPAVCQNVCRYVIIALLLIASTILGFAFLPYAIILQGSTACQSNYILSYDTTQCGYGNSLQYNGVDVKGCPIEGDIMADTLTVRRIHDHELKLYFKSPVTVPDNGLKTEHSTFLLLGWQIYTWRESIIAGFCCITNDNNETKTASLYMFRRNIDANHFKNGEGARNAIISEHIDVPPKQTSCFHKWGIDAPYTVKHSAYHYIGLDLPANINYTSNITVTQSYVNISDYPNSAPQYFRRDNHSHFPYPHTWFKRSDYLFICNAPLYLPEKNPSTSQHPGVISIPIYASKKTTLISRSNSFVSFSSYVSEANMTKPDPSNAVSLHVCTCNNPYPWMKPTAIGITATGGFGVISILLIVGCLYLYKFRYRLYIDYLRYCYVARDRYRRFQAEE